MKKPDFHQAQQRGAQSKTEEFQSRQHEKQHQSRRLTPTGPLPAKKQSREATGGYHK